MVALSSGDNGGRCASASLLTSHTLDPVCHLESRLVTEPWREHRETRSLSIWTHSHHTGTAAAAWVGIQILALRLGLLKVSLKGINWMNKSI